MSKSNWWRFERVPYAESDDVIVRYLRVGKEGKIVGRDTGANLLCIKPEAH